MLLRKNKVYMAVTDVITGGKNKRALASHINYTLPLKQAADSLGYVLGSHMALKGLNVLCH